MSWISDSCARPLAADLPPSRAALFAVEHAGCVPRCPRYRSACTLAGFSAAMAAEPMAFGTARGALG